MGKNFILGFDFVDVGLVVVGGEVFFVLDLVDLLSMIGRLCSKLLIYVLCGWCLMIGIEFVFVSDICIV